VNDFYMFIGLALLVGMYTGLWLGVWAERKDAQDRRRKW